jgi:Domain of unknown function (DUF4214)/Bacterial Ig-like domain (group 3)
VSFKDGTRTIGTATVGPGGAARLTTSGLFGGTRTIAAFYAGDANFQGSSSGGVLQTTTGTPNQLFVAGLYHTLLGRGPDAASLPSWVNALQSRSSRLDVVRGIYRSPEYAGIQVDRFYAAYLHRSAEPAGRAFWTRAFTAGASETDIQRGFVASREYQNAHPENAAFVAAVFQHTLGRAADAAGQAASHQRLQNGESRDSMALGFLTSPENYGRILDRYYNDFLGHAADPVGRQMILALLTAGTGSSPHSVGEAFLGSDEFFTRSTGNTPGSTMTPSTPRPPTPPRRTGR